ncbi:MAG: cellulose biosynthesis protein BcsS [Burkholderiales bacterium]
MRNIRECANLLAIIGICVVGMQSASAESGIALTGADESQHSSYEYVGGIISLEYPFAENGPLAKIWVDKLRYDYMQSNTKVQANATGLQVAAGYQWLRPTGFTSVYLGVASRNTQLPAGVTSSQLGTLTGAVAELDFTELLTSQTRFESILSYTDSSRDYWGRARFMSTTTGTWRWGPEIVSQGNPDYSAYRLGIAVTGIKIGEKAYLEGSTGYANTHQIGGGAYAGIALMITF